MDQKISRKPHSPEFRERAVRLFLEHRPEYAREVAALRALAEKLGCSPDSLRVWARQAQRDDGDRPGKTSAEKARIRERERENRELRQADEILKKASAYFAQAELDRVPSASSHSRSFPTPGSNRSAAVCGTSVLDLARHRGVLLAERGVRRNRRRVILLEQDHVFRVPRLEFRIITASDSSAR